LTGAGINLGVSAACPFADEMLNFTYQKISMSVFQRIDPHLQELFSPESFDYILGGLLTVNLAIEKTKQDLKRFKMNEEAFANLFRQSHLQSSIVDALEQLETQLTISLRQMLEVVTAFSPSINRIAANYNSIDYFTVNFDGIFDHIIYGPQYSRKDIVTDYWRGNGEMNQKATQPIKIHHLHGDLRYKPSKITNFNKATYRWPVLVVGDQEIKKGIIAGNEALRFYNRRLNSATEAKSEPGEHTLVVIGFGFRDEDEHIVARIRHGIEAGAFDRVFLYDPCDRLENMFPARVWIHPAQMNLIDFLGLL
jgi:hypothetical protein